MKKQTTDKTPILIKALTEIKRLKKEVKDQQEPIAIIGMACRFPGGINSPEEYWNALLEQKNMIGKVPDNRWENYDQEKLKNNPFLQKGGFLFDDVYGFDHRLFRLSPNEVEKTDPQQRLFLKVCWEALENSGYAPDSLKGSKTGIYAGVSSFDHLQQLLNYKNENSPTDPNDAMGAGFSFISGRASYFFGFQGPGISTDTACSSSLVSVDLACKGLLSGDCDMAIAGGVNLMLSPETTELMASLNVLSQNCEIKTFDAAANGTVRGEGSGVVILKKISDAKRDGDHIHAIIKGSGTNQDGLSAGLTAPYGPAQEKLIKEVWKRSKINAADIDFIETHGTGTALGDPIEITALGNVISSNRETPIYLGAVKTAIGHLEAAAGIAGLIKIILAVEKGKIPGNLHFKTPSPHINWSDQKFKIPQKTIPWNKTTLRKAAISAFGLSGTNAHIVIEEHPCDSIAHKNKETPDAKRSWPFKFSAVTKAGLKNQLHSFLSFIKEKTPQQLGSLSYSQNSTKADLKEKIVVWGETTEALKTNLEEAIKGVSNAVINRSTSNKKIVFLYSGGGSQYPGMFKGFYTENKYFKKYMDQCNQIYKNQTQNNLLEKIFSSDNTVHEMRYTQVALFFVEYSLSKMWMDYGLTPNLLIGHSTGEYIAACLAEIFTLEDAIQLITIRGELMYSLPKNGTMAAIFTDETTVQNNIKNIKNVTIAAVNTPEQTVISGTEKQVQKVCQLFKEKGIDTKKLDVSLAAHSPLMKPMLTEFENVSKKIKYHVPTKNIRSSVTGKDITLEMTTWHYWSTHILSTVKFCTTIQSIHNSNDYIFLEVGPSPTLITIVEQITKDGAEIIASNYKDEKTAHRIEKSLFQLYLCGAPINWKAYYNNSNLIKIRVPNYMFREKHFKLSPSLEAYTLPKTTVWEKIKENINNSSLTKEEKEHSPAILDFIKNTPLIKPENEEDIEEEQEVTINTFTNISELKNYIRTSLIKEWEIEEEDLQNDENLLLLGLNSIVIIRLITFWKKDLAITLKPALFLKQSTINQWTEIVHKALHNTLKEINNTPVSIFQAFPKQRHESFPLNEIQYAYWAGRNHEMDWGGVSCSAYFEMDIENLSIQHFDRALQNLIKRHEMLRCIISKDGKQQIKASIPTPLIIYKKTDIPSLKEHLQQLRDEMATKIIPLGEPMFEMRISELENHKHRIHFTIDFLIADALSLFIFWKDLYLLYTGVSLNPLEISYKDYLHYHNKRTFTNTYHQAEQYWTNRIQHFPLAPQLPVKDTGKKQVEGHFKRREHWIDPISWNSFIKSAATKNLTPSAALLTLYTEVLSAWGGGSHFAVMLTVFNRDNVHPQINEIIGDFTQLTLVEIERKQQATGKNGTTIQAQMHTDLENSTYSAIEFVKKLNSQSDTKNRMYPFVFTSALGIDTLKQDEQQGFLNQINWSVSSTPQVWIDHQIYHQNGGVTLSWDTLDAVFPRDMIAAMFEKYTELVQLSITDNTFWDKSLTDLRTSKQLAVQQEANNTFSPIGNLLLHEKIYANALQTPKSTAIIYKQKEYSYKQLIKRANQVSVLLQKNSLKKGDKVALQMAKSFDQIAVVLGILQIGAIYIPFTYNQPINRTIEILKQSEAIAIFTDQILDTGKLDVKQFTPPNIDTIKDLYTSIAINPSELAYIIYTSGSTGIPKGVCIQHKAAMNTIIDVNNKLKITEKDRVLGVSSLSFDLSVYDIFGLLHAGGTLVLPTEEERIDPKCWKTLSSQHQVSIWNSVPALMDIYCDYMLKNPTVGKDLSLCKIIHSGDWIPLGLIQKINTAIPHATLTSMGGATEASIWSNYYHVDVLDPDWKSIPYGYPLANQEFYILDTFNRPCPEWVEGKLHIAGKGLATGYLKEKKRSNSAFFFEKELQQRLYDTGDYGRYRQGNIIEFLGRKDTQLKINGYRVEIGEIQAAFRKYATNTDPIIIPIGDKMEHKKLIAFVKCPASEFSETELKMHLKTQLPDYFIPEKILCLDVYPMSANGKVDRKKLLKYYHKYNSDNTPISSNTAEEHHPVLNLIKNILGLPKLKSKDNFSDLGVSSVAMIKLANELEIHFTERPSVGEMIRYSSIKQLIAYYDDKGFSFEEKEIPSDKAASPFSLYSTEQKAYLNNITTIENYEEYISFKETISAHRTDLSLQNSISLDLPLEEKNPLGTITNSFNNYLNSPIENLNFKKFISFCLQQNIYGEKSYNYNSLSETYPIQTYLTIFNKGIEGIEQGNYYLDVQAHSLIKLGNITEIASISFRNMMPNTSFLVHFVADLNAVYPIHQDKSLQICFIESGILSQLLESKSPSLNIGCSSLTAYDFDEIKASFNLSIHQFYLHTMAGGKIDFAQEIEQLQLRSDTTADKDSLKTCDAILNTCKDKEILLYVKEGKLKFKAPKGALSKTLLEKIKASKNALLHVLIQPKKQEQVTHILRKYQPFKLTPIQLAYLFGRSSNFEIGNINTHYYLELECHQLDPKRLEHAWNGVIKRHEMLRTKVYSNASQQLMKKVPFFTIPVRQIQSEQALETIRNKWSHHNYQLGTWPMFHLQLSQIGTDISRIHFSFDCLLLDASSTEMVVQELFASYYGKEIATPKFTFKEYMNQEEKWLHTQSNISEAQQFWNAHIKQIPPAPNLPLKTAFKDIEKPFFKRWKIVLDTEKSTQLFSKIKQYRFTPSAVICTIFMKVLAHWSTNPDFTINLTIFNRFPIHKDVPKILGDFTNVTLISYFKNDNKTILEEIETVQQQLWKAVEYRTQDGMDILKRLGKDSPGKALMPIVFTSLLFGETQEKNTHYPPELKEVFAISQTPQVAMDHQVYERNGSIHINWDIVDNVFENKWIEEMVRTYENMLHQFIALEDWDQYIEIPQLEKSNH